MSEWAIYSESNLVLCNKYEARHLHDSLHDFWQVRLLPDAPTEKARIIFQTDDKTEVIRFFLDEYEKSAR